MACFSEEVDAYLDELKKQIDNLRILLASVEQDTPEGFEQRKQLVGLLVESISLARGQKESHAEIQITYRFGSPPDSDAKPGSLSMPHFKNGSRS